MLSSLVASISVVEIARADDESLVLRRQTLIMRDIDASLSLYVELNQPID
jgi:hypothetical protein